MLEQCEGFVFRDPATPGLDWPTIIGKVARMPLQYHFWIAFGHARTTACNAAGPVERRLIGEMMERRILISEVVRGSAAYLRGQTL